MFCSKCGSKLEDGARFCSNCGTTLGQPANFGEVQGGQPQANNPQAYSAPGVQYTNNQDQYSYSPNQYANAPMQYSNMPGQRPKAGMSKRNTIIIASAAAVVVIAVVLILVLSGGNKPSDTVKKFIDSANNKDVVTMLSCVDIMNAQGFNMSTLTSIASREFKISIMNIVSETIDGDTAYVVANVLIREGSIGEVEPESEQDTFTLRKINGKWKIVAIDN